jgi:hypothetical protein
MEPKNRPHQIHNGINGANFMKMNPVEGRSMNVRFHNADPVKSLNGLLSDLRWQTGLLNQPPDILKAPVIPMVMLVVCVIMAVAVGIV